MCHPSHHTMLKLMQCHVCQVDSGCRSTCTQGSVAHERTHTRYTLHATQSTPTCMLLHVNTHTRSLLALSYPGELPLTLAYRLARYIVYTFPRTFLPYTSIRLLVR